MIRYMKDIPLGDSLQRKLLENTHIDSLISQEHLGKDHYNDTIKKKKKLKKAA